MRKHWHHRSPISASALLDGNKKGRYGMKNKKEFKKLYGWDDGKIYFMDEERKKEWCVTDNKELYNQLMEICRKYLKVNEAV